MSYFIAEIPMGLVYAVLAMGIFISLRVLNVPDLTTEGSFGVGAILGGFAGVTLGAFFSLPVALAAGAAAGFLTGFMQTKLCIHPVLSGIITMNMLYSVNLFLIHIATEKIDGVKNTNLNFGKNTIFRILFDAFGISVNLTEGILLKIAILCGVAAVLLILLVWFFSTNTGLAIRATGNNEDMVRASSINVDATKIIAISLANACVALSGAVLAQYQGFADIGSGIGIVVVGLASVIIGEVLFGRRSLSFGLFSAVLGAVVYRFIIAIVLKIGIFPAFALKLVSSIVVALALSVPAVKHALRLRRRKKQGRKEAASC